jgi:hypothetical protein
MTLRWKAQWAVAGCICLFAASPFAGEKVQFKGSTSIELPKPKRSFEDSRVMRLPEAPSGENAYNAGVAAGTPVNTTPMLDKRLKEFLDKKKNWIFVNPYEMQFDSKTEEFMQGEKGTGLYENHLMKEEDKSVMEKYLNERNPSRDKDPDSRGPDRESDHGGRAEMIKAMEHSDPASEPVVFSKMTDRVSIFTLEQKAPALFSGDSIFDKKPDRGGIFDRGSSDNVISKEDLRKERDNRDAELSRMLQPKNFSSPGSRLDPVTTVIDTGRQDGALLGGRRTESFLSPGRSQSAVGTVGGISAGGGNSPIFSGSTPSSVANRSSIDFGTKAGVSAGNGPALGINTSPITAPSRPSSQVPFVLPRPSRKF